MKSYRQWIRHGLLLMLLLGASSLARAGCTTAASTITLGTQNSFAVSTSPQITSGGSGLSCTGPLLSIGGTNTITATIGATLHPSGTQPRLYSAATGQYLAYNLCKDSSCGTVYNQGDAISWSSTTALGLLGLFSGPNGTLPLYVMPKTLSNLAAGTYTDTVPIAWAWNICSIAVGSLLCIADTGNVSGSVNLTLNITNFCYIDSAPNVGFGSAALPSGLTTVVSNTISVRCTLNATYSVNLTSSVPVSGQYRQMASTVNGTTSYLQYQLFKGDSTVWTAATNSSATGTGTSQSFPYTASVNLTQANQPAGAYSDTVTVTVTY